MPGRTSANTSDMRQVVSVSTPFDAQTIFASDKRWPAASDHTFRSTWDGVADRMSRAPASASANEVVARKDRGRLKSGKKARFTWWLLISFATSCS